MDNLTKEQRRKNMQHIRSKDSVIEKKLRKALWERGYRYRKYSLKNLLKRQETEAGHEE